MPDGGYVGTIGEAVDGFLDTQEGKLFVAREVIAALPYRAGTIRMHLNRMVISGKLARVKSPGVRELGYQERDGDEAVTEDKFTMPEELVRVMTRRFVPLRADCAVKRAPELRYGFTPDDARGWARELIARL